MRNTNQHRGQTKQPDDASDRRNASHPTYAAMLEVGRAQRTIFAARYLRDRQLQREITEGLNVVEAFNGANAVIYYGKGAEISSNTARLGRHPTT